MNDISSSIPQNSFQKSFDWHNKTCYIPTTIQRKQRYNSPRIHIRKNEEIRAGEVRVIDDTGENKGVMTAEEALKMAKAAGLDLVETAAQATPPIVKITSFDKYRYETEKRLKKERIDQKQKGQEMKQIQISVREAKNDLEIKAKRANEFLERGDKVMVVMRMRGRERANKGFAREKLLEFLQTYITIEHKALSEPRFAGRGMNITIVKK
ncbi:MAG: translation initiation factor IF-3 [Candidatus Harrisonbacteria bacterium CG10_big_fil_rev_8_21_14_0_10_42_17]|uniref:Translation initiation factor IF-3 n=1 Tax=Candidatus Harrisonbacteria bacterium CG10_big_fil_rev_8_21_14_0_10_42_17 TaxID=1974584 RepID=A0A2M6WI44_9BACT|nr:MAG: translation initiation factor IF-3 [Candidatus Harrisonbacteria bacterium CG10_big_fil_rev_8_21_14_0_10_42_17]